MNLIEPGYVYPDFLVKRCTEAMWNATLVYLDYEWDNIEQFRKEELKSDAAPTPQDLRKFCEDKLYDYEYGPFSFLDIVFDIADWNDLLRRMEERFDAK